MNERELDRSGWYAPMKAPAAEKGKKRRSLKKLWICLGCLALVLAIVLSSLLFSRPGQGSSYQGSGFPEDWQDVMEDYFTQADTEDWTTDLPLAEDQGPFDLELMEPGEEELSLQELYERCSPSIVSITAYAEDEAGYVWGSGVIASSDGLIVTNAHIIQGCNSATVTLSDGESHQALLVAADGVSDLAYLKIDAQGLPAAEFGDSDTLVVGDKVVAIGNPLSETFRSTLTDGVISGIGRGLNYNGYTMNLLQTNAAINSGNSGGALFNIYGQVVGITNMKMMSYYSSIEGIGLAIPSTTVRSVLTSLVEHGQVLGRASIGITVGQVPWDVAEHYELPQGLYITQVQEGSDAQAKGVQPGDILTHIDGQEVYTTQDVAQIRDTHQPGDSITMTLWREGETIELDIELMDTTQIYN